MLFYQPDNKILDLSSLKAIADNKRVLVFHNVENIVGKGENAGSHNVFIRLLKTSVCVVKCQCLNAFDVILFKTQHCWVNLYQRYLEKKPVKTS